MAQRYFPVVWDTIEDALKALHTQYLRYEDIDTGNGGSETLQEVLTNGSLLDSDNTINLNGTTLLIIQGQAGKKFIHLIPDENFEQSFFGAFSAETNQRSGLQVYANSDDGFLSYLTSKNGINTTEIEVNSDEDIFEITAGNGIKINNETGATGSFVSQDGKTVTITNGIITAITE